MIEHLGTSYYEAWEKYDVWKKKYPNKYLITPSNYPRSYGGYGHVIGHIVKIFKKRHDKKGYAHYVIIGEEGREDNLAFIIRTKTLGQYPFLNNLIKEPKGTKVIIHYDSIVADKNMCFTLHSPRFYKVVEDEKGDFSSDLRKREEHRIITLHLYRKVYERDNFKCQMCGSKSNIEVHHVNYKDYGNDEENMKHMITFCRNCHEKAFQEQLKGGTSLRKWF